MSQVETTPSDALDALALLDQWAEQEGYHDALDKTPDALSQRQLNRLFNTLSSPSQKATIHMDAAVPR